MMRIILPAQSRSRVFFLPPSQCLMDHSTVHPTRPYATLVRSYRPSHDAAESTGMLLSLNGGRRDGRLCVAGVRYARMHLL